MNQENICNSLKPKEIKDLSENDSLKILYDIQEKFQDRLGKLQEYKNSNMHQKACEVIYNKHCLEDELSELLTRLPWKKWKKYSFEELKNWISDEQRTETLFELVDGLHFFLNIAIILGFSPEEIFQYYIEKNKENHNRQIRGY
jgi:dimeric dUTPase (all-alpha-NTP-PPase superfamily)